MLEKGKASSDIYNFQAQFNDPDTCKNFAYLIKGFRRNLGNGEHTKDASPLSDFDETRLMRKLVTSARRAKESVFSSKHEASDEN